MPLDGHGHLVAQGWGGSGSGLRTGSISKPIIIAQKKNLAGVGKDRDEAFPFWDHVFNAAVGAIQIKIATSDTDDSDASDSESPAQFQPRLTSTGILSNRRPPSGISADSGATTPTHEGTPAVNLMVLAKREAARKGLYARFFRGPVIGPDSNETVLAATEVKVVDVKGKGKANGDVDGMEDVVITTETAMEGLSSKKDKKRKRGEDKAKSPAPIGEDEAKSKKKKKKRPKDDVESASTPNAAATESAEQDDEASHDPASERQLLKAQRRSDKEARRQRKADRAEKRAKKEERAARKAAKAKS